MATSPLGIRFVDRKGQRVGAGSSAVVLILSIATGLVPVVAIVAVAVAASAAFGTRYFLFGRLWPIARRAFGLAAGEREPEIPPRFAQALGAIALSIALLLFAAGSVVGWLFVAAVAGLQVLLAVTGFCLGCRLYGLHWILPSLFDRAVGAVRPGSR